MVRPEFIHSIAANRVESLLCLTAQRRLVRWSVPQEILCLKIRAFDFFTFLPGQYLVIGRKLHIHGLLHIYHPKIYMWAYSLISLFLVTFQKNITAQTCFKCSQLS